MAKKFKSNLDNDKKIDFADFIGQPVLDKIKDPTFQTHMRQFKFIQQVFN